MNKTLKTVISLLIITSLTVLFVSADSEYSTKTDPLISLSYLNDIYTPEIVENVMDRVNSQYEKKDGDDTTPSSYVPLTLKKGETLMAKGPCEVIVLDGTVNAVITSAANIKAGNGLIYPNNGTVVKNGQTLALNFYVVIPSADGRGITSIGGDSNILIRGEYNIA